MSSCTVAHAHDRVVDWVDPVLGLPVHPFAFRRDQLHNHNNHSTLCCVAGCHVHVLRNHAVMRDIQVSSTLAAVPARFRKHRRNATAYTYNRMTLHALVPR